MGEIRPFTEEFLAEAASLSLRIVRGLSQPASPALQNGFRDIFLASPWATPDIPSLVYLDQGKLVGFLGVVPRTMEFRGRVIRSAVTTQFCVDRQAHRGNAALELMRHYFRAPQELSLTDGAGEASSMVWTAAGGKNASLYSFNWIRLLRPAGAVRGALDRFHAPWLSAAAGWISSPADWLLAQLPLAPLQVPQSTHTAHLVSSEELFACIQEIGWRDLLKPHYEWESFRWMLHQAAGATILGSLRLVEFKDAQQARSGWAVYYAKPGGAAYLLQLGLRRRHQFGDILRALFRDAWELNCSAMKGQAIPAFLTALTEQYCIFRHPNPSVLVHTKDPEMMQLIQSGEAAITRLDGECWLPLNSLR